MKGFLFVLILAALVSPLAAVAFPGCPESSATTDCIVDSDRAVPNSLANAVFQYRTFRIDPGHSVTIATQNTLENHGGNVTIIAKTMEIAGSIAADGAPGTNGWTLHGGNGGLITLIARDRLFVGNNGAVNAIGANGRQNNCTVGNGGNGGRVIINTVSGANVNIQGVVNTSSGLGAIVSDMCITANGTNGTSGAFETNNNYSLIVKDFTLAQTPPNLIVLTAGTNATISITAIDQFGDAITPSSTEWTTDNSTVTILTNGNATQVTIVGNRVGAAVVKIKVGIIEKTLNVLVVPGAFDHITVNATGARELVYGQGTPFEIRSFDAAGNEVPIPEADYGEVEFEFLDVANESTFAGLQICLLNTLPCNPNQSPYEGAVIASDEPGNIVLRITHKNSTFDLAFKVFMSEDDVMAAKLVPYNTTVASNGQIQFTFIGIDVHGYEQAFEPEGWTVTNRTGSGSISADGILTAGAPGLVIVSGKLNSYNPKAFATTNLTVVIGAPHHVNVTGPSRITAGVDAEFSAVVVDSYGSAINYAGGSNQPIFTWSTSSGTIYQNGTLVTTHAGVTNVTAQLASDPAIKGTASIQVDPSEVNALIIAESGAMLIVGNTYSLTAVLIDKYGNAIAETDATWTILNGTGQASLNGKLITGTKAGNVNVRAVSITNSSLYADGILFISPNAPASITLLPSMGSIRPGETIQFTIDAFDAFNNKYLFLNSGVNWTASNSTVATISQSGLLTALNPGVTTVTAMVNNTTVSATVTIQVLPSLEAQSQQLAASLVSGLPVVTIPGQAPRATINIESPNGLAAGLSGLFTAGSGDSEVLLVAALALLLIGTVAYYVGTRR